MAVFINIIIGTIKIIFITILWILDIISYCIFYLLEWTLKLERINNDKGNYNKENEDNVNTEYNFDYKINDFNQNNLGKKDDIFIKNNQKNEISYLNDNKYYNYNKTNDYKDNKYIKNIFDNNLDNKENNFNSINTSNNNFFNNINYSSIINNNCQNQYNYCRNFNYNYKYYNYDNIYLKPYTRINIFKDKYYNEKYFERKTSIDKIEYGYMYKLPDIKNRLLVLDIEVTGKNEYDRIIEICAREMINGLLTGKKFHSYFKPKFIMSNDSIKRHKVPKIAFTLTSEDEKSILQNFLKFQENSIIIAHNAKYDMEKINKELEYHHLPKINRYKYRCSMRIFLQNYSNISKKFSKLKECCDFFKIKYNNDNLHTAIYDSYLLGKIMQKMYENELANDKINKISNICKIKEINNENNISNLNLNNIYKKNFIEKKEIKKLDDKMNGDIFLVKKEKEGIVKKDEEREKFLERHLDSTIEENELEKFINNNIDLIVAEFDDKSLEKYLNDNI